jgi:hypothetical protein
MVETGAPGATGPASGGAARGAPGGAIPASAGDGTTYTGCPAS